MHKYGKLGMVTVLSCVRVRDSTAQHLGDSFVVEITFVHVHMHHTTLESDANGVGTAG